MRQQAEQFFCGRTHQSVAAHPTQWFSSTGVSPRVQNVDQLLQHSDGRQMNTSWPAQAIMAPLSVHSAGGGTTSCSPAADVVACDTLGWLDQQWR